MCMVSMRYYGEDIGTYRSILHCRRNVFSHPLTFKNTEYILTVTK